MDFEITFEVELITPPRGVGFCLQKGKNELVDYQLSNGENILFDFSARMRQGDLDTPNFLGKYTQGRPGEKFVYICIGECAGQKNFEWSRRAKIHLSSISWLQIDQVLSCPKSKLVARFLATDKNGAPSCASVPLIDGGWSLANG